MILRTQLVLLTLAACATGGSTQPEPATLKVGESATVADVDVTFIEVASDNRCPPDVDCLVAGEAVVVLRVETGDGIRLEMRIAVPPEGVGRQHLEDRDVVVELAPEARSDRRLTQDEYVATVGIEQAGDGG